MYTSSDGIMLLTAYRLTCVLIKTQLTAHFTFYSNQIKSRRACIPAEEWDLHRLMSNPRLLTSWCWRKKGFSAFSPSAPPSNGANGLPQELLLGFDVSPGCEHSVLSMTVERTQAADRVASTWATDLQASWYQHYRTA